MQNIDQLASEEREISRKKKKKTSEINIVHDNDSQDEGSDGLEDDDGLGEEDGESEEDPDDDNDNDSDNEDEDNNNREEGYNNETGSRVPGCERERERKEQEEGESNNNIRQSREEPMDLTG
ncbi:hypothetical protein EV360DRAFT_89734 [Lentinula raphanica]|nr:hypothetical protein EV360DRAFT_89734 [Lentinula raphanica]